MIKLLLGIVVAMAPVFSAGLISSGEAPMKPVDGSNEGIFRAQDPWHQCGDGSDPACPKLNESDSWRSFSARETESAARAN